MPEANREEARRSSLARSGACFLLDVPALGGASPGPLEPRAPAGRESLADDAPLLEHRRALHHLTRTPTKLGEPGFV